MTFPTTNADTERPGSSVARNRDALLGYTLLSRGLTSESVLPNTERHFVCAFFVLLLRMSPTERTRVSVAMQNTSKLTDTIMQRFVAQEIRNGQPATMQP
jgi:hypothetical protein